MKPSSIPLAGIAAFAHEGRVFRSFRRLLAVRSGQLLAVPVVLAAGDFSTVVDGCPVPWHEVFAAIDTPVAADARLLMPDDMAFAHARLSALFSPYGWRQDWLLLSQGSLGVARVISPDGVVYCWVPTGD